MRTACMYTTKLLLTFSMLLICSWITAQCIHSDTLSGCPDTLYVGNQNTPSPTIPTGVYSADEYLNSDGSVSPTDKVDYKSKHIRLDKGFRVLDEGEFSAYLGECEAELNVNKYYVNDSSLEGDVYTSNVGSDLTGTGSKENPFASLKHIITEVDLLYGDIIYVDAGTFNDSFIEIADITNNLAIIGAGSTNTIFNRNYDAENNENEEESGAGEYPPIGAPFMTISSDDILLKGMTIQGYNYFSPGRGNALSIVSGNCVVIDDVNIFDNAGYGESAALVIFGEGNSVEMRHSSISYNYGFEETAQGGGIDIIGNDNVVNIDNTSIAGNGGEEVGGGIRVFGNNDIEITNSTLSGNVSGSGGGAISSIGESTFTLTSICLIGNSTVPLHGGVTHGEGETLPIPKGGALQFGAYTREVSISNVLFENNYAGSQEDYGRGGAIYVGDVHSTSDPSMYRLNIDGCEFKDNSATHGSDIYVENFRVSIDNSEFKFQEGEGVSIFNGGIESVQVSNSGSPSASDRVDFIGIALSPKIEIDCYEPPLGPECFPPPAQDYFFCCEEFEGTYPRISDVVLPGIFSNISWYEYSNWGNPLPSNTIITNGKVLYAADNSLGCSGDRNPITFYLISLDGYCGNSIPTGGTGSVSIEFAHTTNSAYIVFGIGIVGTATTNGSTVTSEPIIACEGEQVTIANTYTELPGLDYQWNTTAGLTFPNSPGGPITAQVNAPITYEVVVTSPHCGGSRTIVFPVIIGDGGHLTFPSNESICEGGQVQLIAAGGEQYEWSSQAGLSCYDCPNPTASPSGNTTYSLTITDDTGCEYTEQVTVFIGSAPTINAGVDQVVCIGDEVILSASGAVADSYYWEPASAGLSNNFGPSTSFIANENNATSYTLTVYNNGCIAQDEVTISLKPEFNTDFTAEPDLCSVLLSVDPFSPELSYEWFVDGESFSVDTSYLHEFSNNGTYEVCLKVVGSCDQEVTTCETVVATGCDCADVCSGIYISEFAYTCEEATPEGNEMIEIAIPNTMVNDIANIEIVLYDGDPNVLDVYDVLNGSNFIQGDVINGTHTLFYIDNNSFSQIQNGGFAMPHADGIALIYQDNLCQFISYEGTITLPGGSNPADGATSTDIGVTQYSSTTCDQSIQLYNGTWLDACATPGEANNNEQCCPGAFINEFAYDCEGPDEGEFIEVAIPIGFNPADFQIDLYDGFPGGNNVGILYDSNIALGTTPDYSDANYDYYTVFVSPIQDGGDNVVHDDGIALSYNNGTSLCDFINYEGLTINETMTGVGGPADGATSTNVGVPLNFYNDTPCMIESVQLFNGTWAIACATPGEVNTDQSCSDLATDCPGGMIVEFAYDCGGADSGEFIEVAIPIGSDPSDFEIDLYKGSGEVYDSNITLGTTPDYSDANYDYYTVYVSPIQNGGSANVSDTDGIALSFNNGTFLCHFINYEGEVTITALNGPAEGETSTNVGVYQIDDFPCMEESIQFFGDTWFNACATPGEPNINQLCFDCPYLMANIGDSCNDGDPDTDNDLVQDDCSCLGLMIECPNAFINEFAYDCDGADSGEFIEVAIPVGFDPADFQIDLYNGVSGETYSTISLGTTPNYSNANYNYYIVSAPGLQNGGGTSTLSANTDGIALSFNHGTTLCDFINYEGNGTPMIGVGGPADGEMSINVGVVQLGNFPCMEESIQLFDDVWYNACATPGEPNINQPCFDCPDLMANIGDNCDDGDPTTIYDTVEPNCSCIGIYYDCSDIPGNIGDDCDDEDPDTYNDVVQADCSCIGISYDCPNILANIGDTCNDGDPDTDNDVVQADCYCSGLVPDCTDASITEFTYDCTGSDDGSEFIEVLIPNTYTNLSDFKIYLYRDNGTVYNTKAVSGFVEGDNNGTHTYYHWVWQSSIQNGPADGIALAYDGIVCRFISYEGELTATEYPAEGMTSEDVGVAQSEATSCDNESIQFNGTGWVSACNSTPGAQNTPIQPNDACNDGDPTTTNDVIQDDCSCAGLVPDCTDASITEFTYDCMGSDDNHEFIEVLIPNTYVANLSGFRIYLYNGSNGTVYDTKLVSGFTEGDNNGTHTYYYIYDSSPSIQNGSPDGIALAYNGIVCEFISYEGQLTATDGPAQDMVSEDVGVEQSNSGTPCDNSSIQFNGIEWVSACNSTPGAQNNPLNPNDTCDDGNPATVNDSIRPDCTCLGVIPNISIGRQ